MEDITEGSQPPKQSLSLGPAHNPPRVNSVMGLLTFSLADIISTVEFDHTGNYLATGDKGGRVVLFERNETVSGLVGSPEWSAGSAGPSRPLTFSAGDSLPSFSLGIKLR